MVKYNGFSQMPKPFSDTPLGHGPCLGEACGDRIGAMVHKDLAMGAATNKDPKNWIMVHESVAVGAGITRERLESFDRPIKVEPEDYPDKRDALISEFRNYLSILKVTFPPTSPATCSILHACREFGRIVAHIWEAAGKRGLGRSSLGIITLDSLALALTWWERCQDRPN